MCTQLISGDYFALTARKSMLKFNWHLMPNGDGKNQ